MIGKKIITLSLLLLKNTLHAGDPNKSSSPEKPKDTSAVLLAFNNFATPNTKIEKYSINSIGDWLLDHKESQYLDDAAMASTINPTYLDKPLCSYFRAKRKSSGPTIYPTKAIWGDGYIPGYSFKDESQEELIYRPCSAEMSLGQYRIWKYKQEKAAYLNNSPEDSK